MVLIRRIIHPLALALALTLVSSLPWILTFVGRAGATALRQRIHLGVRPRVGCKQGVSERIGWMNDLSLRLSGLFIWCMYVCECACMCMHMCVRMCACE